MAARVFRTYLDLDLADFVETRSVLEKRSVSAVIADAVRLRMAATAESALRVEEDSIKRRLARAERRLDKIVWECAQIKEIGLLAFKVWLEYNPQLDAEQEESAVASAEARFERFLDSISAMLNAGRSFANVDERIGLGQEEDREPELLG